MLAERGSERVSWLLAAILVCAGCQWLVDLQPQPRWGLVAFTTVGLLLLGCVAVLGPHHKAHGWRLEFQQLQEDSAPEAAAPTEETPGISADPDLNKANSDTVKALVQARELVDKAKSDGQKLFLATEKQIEAQMNTYLTEVCRVAARSCSGLLR
jgi:hypothetical protein